MVATHPSRSAAIRARVGHPIIDTDGHTVEVFPVLWDYVREIAGHEMAERLVGPAVFTERRFQGFRMSPAERHDTWTAPGVWWNLPTRNTRDRATASLPRLLHERMDALGLDYTILYPTDGVAFPSYPEDEPRRVACRALNAYHADLFREYADRMTAAAAIPMHTPEEAIEELEYAVKTLGLKVAMIAGHVRRPIPRVARERPELAPYADRLDFFGIDSDYDYDPFWAKCLELKVAPASHAAGMGWTGRRSPSNYMFNHTGHFAAAADALCKALVLGGVTRRFPTLKFAFLECGVGWACDLYAGLIARWEKRNARALQNLNPENLDLDLLMRLMAEYGDERIRARLDDIRAYYALLARQQAPAGGVPDDFALCQVERAEDFRALFEPHFYFGCEADDPMIACAFNTKMNPFGARLRAMLSSDIGHWDVVDMTGVVEEAYELVEKGLTTEEDFRDFAFTHPVSLYAGLNPDFFKGTVVEREAARLVGEGRA